MYGVGYQGHGDTASQLLLWPVYCAGQQTLAMMCVCVCVGVCVCGGGGCMGV